MSKDLHNNERYFKELADKHKPLPPPFVWDEIELVLNKGKGKRRFFPFLWMFGVLLIGAIIFINLRGNKDKETSIVGQETIISDYQNQSDPNPKEIRTTDSEVINEVEQRQNANLSETIPIVSDNQEEHKANSNKLKSFVTQEHQLNNSNTSSVNPSLNANRNTNTNTNTNTFNSNPTAIINKEETFSQKTLTPSTESTLEERHLIQVIASLKMKSLRSPFETGIPLPEQNKNLTDNLSSESKGNTSLAKTWFVELGGGIGRNLSNLALIDPTQGGFRLNTESKWYSWSTSFQFGVQFKNLWYTAIGFDLNQTKNKFDFWRRDVSSLSIDENQSLRITNGDFFSIGEINYTYADVGLSIGKRVNIDKWHFSLEGGPIFNVLFNANGKVQVGASELSRLEDQEEYFKTQIGIGARLSAMLDYPISDQMWVSVGPSYHQYFNTVSSDENPLEERNAILQVKARVRYHF